MDAYNLLALCYINLDNKDGAKEMLKKVLNIDKNNVIAISYLEEIGGTKPNNIINKKTDTKPNFVEVSHMLFNIGIIEMSLEKQS